MATTMIHASYQIVRTTIPLTPMAPNAVEVINTFQAPPGYRLHSVAPQKETQLIGQPATMLMVFESLQQVVVEDGINGTPQGNA